MVQVTVLMRLTRNGPNSHLNDKIVDITDIAVKTMDRFWESLV